MNRQHCTHIIHTHTVQYQRMEKHLHVASHIQPCQKADIALPVSGYPTANMKATHALLTTRSTLNSHHLQHHHAPIRPTGTITSRTAQHPPTPVNNPSTGCDAPTRQHVSYLHVCKQPQQQHLHQGPTSPIQTTGRQAPFVLCV